MTKLILYAERLPSPIGTVLVLTDDRGRVRAVDFEDRDERMHRLLRRHYGADGLALTEGCPPSVAGCALEAYFAGDLSAVDRLAVETGGTPFQRAVWAELRNIRSGRTVGYGTLAARLGRPKAVRAVGLANGANPVSIIVPCHRVIGVDGSLAGYAGGLERKRWLLEHEGADWRDPRRA